MSHRAKKSLAWWLGSIATIAVAGPWVWSCVTTVVLATQNIAIIPEIRAQVADLSRGQMQIMNTVSNLAAAKSERQYTIRPDEPSKGQPRITKAAREPDTYDQ